MSEALALRHLNTPEGRAQAIRLRRLEITSTLAEWKRAYVVDGVSRPLAQRVTLEAEDAALALEAQRIKAEAVAAQIVRRQALNATLLQQLRLLLEERGLGDLVEEATRRSETLAVSAASPEEAQA
jgi:hypothetical protein